MASHYEIIVKQPSQYENGVREIPLALLVQVAMIFNTSTDYILELTDLSAPYERSEKYK